MLTAPSIGAAAQVDDWRACEKGAGDERLNACTRIIETATEPARKLAGAYSSRAFAQQDKRDLDAAIADFGQAIRYLTQASEAGWSVAFTIYVRGETYMRKGDLERAIADYSESIRIAPGWDKAYNARGAAHFRSGDFERAVADISQVIAFRPSHPFVADSYALRTMLHYRMGQAAKGMPDVDRAIELKPRSALAHYTRGRILEALGRREEAAAGMRTTREIDPQIEQRMVEMDAIRPK